VPIYKGRGGSDSKHKARKPYDPKSQWNPNFSGEQRGYQGSSNRGGYQGSNRGEYYPQYYPENVYTGGNSDAGSIYRNGETWTHYVPVWTTERVPQEQGQIYRRPSWKPCYCMSSADFRRRRDSKAGRDPVDHHKGVIGQRIYCGQVKHTHKHTTSLGFPRKLSKLVYQKSNFHLRSSPKVCLLSKWDCGASGPLSPRYSSVKVFLVLKGP